MGTKSSSSFVEVQLRKNGNTEVNPWVTVTERIELKRGRTGNERPDWKRLVSEGGNATTVLTAYDNTLDFTPGSWTGRTYNEAHKKWYSQSSEVQGCSLQLPPNSVSNYLKVEALSKSTTKANQILSKLLSEFSGQQFMGEFKQTKDLLLNPFGQSLKLIGALVGKRRNSRARGTEIAREVAGSWLEFRFGILPLLNDIDAISKLLTDRIERNTKLAFRAYGASASEVTNVYTGYTDGMFGFIQRREDREAFLAECITRFGISREFLMSANDIKTDWASSFNRLDQVPLTAWELIPFSWLVDYVINVSDLIQAAITSKHGVTFVSRSQIQTASLTRVGSTSTNGQSRFVLTSNVPRVIFSKTRTVQRDGTPIDIPSVVFSLPGSNIRYLNIAALITQILTSK